MSARVFCSLVAAVWLAGVAPAAERVTTRKVVLPTRLSDDLLSHPNLTSVSLPDKWQRHPLAPALQLAVERQEYIRAHVRDFTCVLAKRERIRGRLRDYEYMQTKVRRRSESGGQLLEPQSIFIRYLAPKKVKGRRAIFVEGQNDDHMVVRNGGERFDFVTVKLDPAGKIAMRESHYPITELGLNNVITRLIERARDDIVADPRGENTNVRFFQGAKVDGRSCLHIRVTHPEPDDRLAFHVANLYIDESLGVPIRVEGFDWPASDGEKPELIEEYTYLQLKLNVGLSDRDFSLSQLQR